MKIVPADITADRCEEISRQLGLTVLAAVQTRALIEEANADRALISAFNETYQGHGLANIRFLLMQSLLMQIVRCWDKYGNNRASFASLVFHLKLTGVMGVFAERAAAWHPGGHFAQRNRELIVERLPKFLESIEMHNDPEHQTRLSRLRNYRDTYVAHNLNKNEEKPLYKDIFSLLDETMILMDEAELLLRGHNPLMDDNHEESVRQARSFWYSVRVGQEKVKQEEAAQASGLDDFLKD